MIQLLRLRSCLALIGNREAISGPGRRSKHVQHSGREALAGIGDTTSHRHRLEIVEGVGDLFVDRSFALLDLALDREGLVGYLANAEDVDASVFPMIDLPILISR